MVPADLELKCFDWTAQLSSTMEVLMLGEPVSCHRGEAKGGIRDTEGEEREREREKMNGKQSTKMNKNC